MRFTWIVLIILFNVASNNGGRIIGGKPATDGEVPWQVTLRRSYNDQMYCGGSIISDSFILTAAHCVFSVWGNRLLDPKDIKIFAGSLSINKDSSTVARNVNKIIPHENYDYLTMFYDIALLKLSSPLEFNVNKNIAPINLCTTNRTAGLCKVSGFGKTNVSSSEPVSQTLQIADVSIIEIEQCQEMYAVEEIELDDFSMMCAGHAEGLTDACQGDSGGPLACFNELIGVVSTGKGCAQHDFPGIYANVCHLADWIRESMENENENEQTTLAPSPPDNIYAEILKYLQYIMSSSVMFPPNFYVTIISLIFIKFTIS